VKQEYALLVQPFVILVMDLLIKIALVVNQVFLFLEHQKYV
jgi:hypothetical protein